MHPVVSNFVKTHNLDEALISGSPRRFNGVDHDDEWWQYGKGFTFSPQYDKNTIHTRVRWGIWKEIFVPDNFYNSTVSEWVEFVEAGLTREEAAMIKCCSLYPWTISGGLITRRVLGHEQTVGANDKGWKYTCKTHMPYLFCLSDNLSTVLMSAEHDAGYFHGKMEL